jgi:hypothetical protein
MLSTRNPSRSSESEEAPSQRNLISGNGGHGVKLNDRSKNHLVAGNLIGTTKNGKGDLGNEGKKFLGVGRVTTNANGNTPFTFSFSTGQTVAALYGTATAIHDRVLGGDSTSEFSAPKTVVAS